MTPNILVMNWIDAMKSQRLALIVGLGMVLAACNAPAVSSGASAPNAKTIVALAKTENHSICPDGSLESGLNLIDDAKSWQAFLKSAGSKAPGLTDWKPNFSNSRIVVFRLGSKSSAGFTVKAVDANLVSGTNDLVLNVQTSKPAAGSFNATVITSPCLIASISSATFKNLSVFDLTEGKSLGQIAQ
jgi:hypothetical protein